MFKSSNKFNCSEHAGDFFRNKGRQGIIAIMRLNASLETTLLLILLVAPRQHSTPTNFFMAAAAEPALMGDGISSAGADSSTIALSKSGATSSIQIKLPQKPTLPKVS